jgi:hypothetical protein
MMPDSKHIPVNLVYRLKIRCSAEVATFGLFGKTWVEEIISVQ